MLRGSPAPSLAAVERRALWLGFGFRVNSHPLGVIAERCA